MEINVWSRRRWFVLVAILGSNLFTFSTAAQKPKNLTSSPNAQKAVAVSTSTSKITPARDENVLTIRRDPMTAGKGESRFGVMVYNGKILCHTLEHESVKIPAGKYRGELRWSERFQETVPYIHVPKRTGIEAHRGNCPKDSGGCVLVGVTRGDACLGNSKDAFARMMSVLPQDFTVVVE